MTKVYPRDFPNDELKAKINEYADHQVDSSTLSLSKYMKAMVGLVELQGRENRRLTTLSLFIAGLSLTFSGLALREALTQTELTELQGRGERILQLQRIQEALSRCEQSPDLQESGLYETTSGRQASCDEVLLLYGNKTSVWDRIHRLFD